jgi:predicted RNA-binding protein with PIN domain
VPSTEARGVCLVDGYNVIHKVPALARLLGSDQEEAREQLREACVRFSLRQRMRVLLVFDGRRGVHAPASRSTSQVEIIYASGERKADGWILSRAEELQRDKYSVTVVTEDRGIKNALPKRVRTLSPRAFWSMVLPTAEHPLDEKPAPNLEDVEAYFLDLERRQKDDRKK